MNQIDIIEKLGEGTYFNFFRLALQHIEPNINQIHKRKLSMKAIKRNFLVVEENIRLNEINDFQIIKFFNPSHFNLEGNINLHFDYSEGLGTENIRIVACYIDTSKSMESYEPLEFFEELKLPFPEGGITKKKELSVSLKLKEDSKLLCKIGIQIFPKIETLLPLSIS